MNKDAVNDNQIPHITIAAFLIGAVLSFATVYWSVKAVPELPLSDTEVSALRAKPTGFQAALVEIWDAIRQMPPTMRRMWWMALFQWYGMMCYWIYIVPSLALTVFGTTEASTPGFREAGLLNGQIGGFYNFIAFLAAFAMVPFTRRFGPKVMHALCPELAALGMWTLPGITDRWMLFLPMVGIGLAWASIMGNTLRHVADSIPPERAGVYMGIFNMFSSSFPC